MVKGHGQTACLPSHLSAQYFLTICLIVIILGIMVATREQIFRSCGQGQIASLGQTHWYLLNIKGAVLLWRLFYQLDSILFLLYLAKINKWSCNAFCCMQGTCYLLISVLLYEKCRICVSLTKSTRKNFFIESYRDHTNHEEIQNTNVMLPFCTREQS